MTEKNQLFLFENYWIKIEENIGSFYMTNFITDFLKFSYKENILSNNAYEKFKNYCKESQLSNEEILQQLSHYSSYYKLFLGRNDDKYSKLVIYCLNVYRQLNQTTIYPFLFHVFDYYNNNVISIDVLENVFKFFLNYLLRRIVCNVPSNSLNGLFFNLYNRIFSNHKSLNNYYLSIIQFFLY